MKVFLSKWNALWPSFAPCHLFTHNVYVYTMLCQKVLEWSLDRLHYWFQACETSNNSHGSVQILSWILAFCWRLVVMKPHLEQTPDWLSAIQISMFDLGDLNSGFPLKFEADMLLEFFSCCKDHRAILTQHQKQFWHTESGCVPMSVSCVYISIE